MREQTNYDADGAGIIALDAWQGRFGDDYHGRNYGDDRRPLWSKVLPLLPEGRLDILEVGAGLGANLEAIRKLRDNVHLFALEPNVSACSRILPPVTTVKGVAQKIKASDERFDLVFTYGVLIHLPDPIPAMQEMYRVTRRYLMCAEYFSPHRQQVDYRKGVALFKDDFGSLWMDEFNLRLVDYGFCWKRTTGLDNVTWTLLEKQ